MSMDSLHAALSNEEPSSLISQQNLKLAMDSFIAKYIDVSTPEWEEVATKKAVIKLEF
jgi:hypothetical protein